MKPISEDDPVEDKWVMGFQLTSEVMLHNPRKGRMTLPPGSLLPLLRMYEPDRKKYRRTPFLVYHEFVGPFLLGRGHRPLRYNLETEEVEDLPEDEGLTKRKPVL